MTPPYAATCWADQTTFYVSLPGPDGPTTLSFPIVSGGIGKALPLLQGIFKAAPRPVSLPSAAYSPASRHIDDMLKKVGLKI